MLLGNRIIPVDLERRRIHRLQLTSQLSANSHSLVNKVRSVAVTLLQGNAQVGTPSLGTGPQETTADQEGALLSFLSLLTQIEDVSPWH